MADIYILDIEAGAAPPRCGVIFEIGVIRLDINRGEVDDSLVLYPDIGQQVAAGLHVDPVVIAWHMADAGRRQRLLQIGASRHQRPSGYVLGRLHGFMFSGTARPVVYTRGPDYDIAMLRHYSQALGWSDDPFPHGRCSLRDIRTAADLHPLPADAAPARHEALSDCLRDMPIVVQHVLASRSRSVA